MDPHSCMCHNSWALMFPIRRTCLANEYCMMTWNKMVTVQRVLSPLTCKRPKLKVHISVMNLKMEYLFVVDRYHEGYILKNGETVWKVISCLCLNGYEGFGPSKGYPLKWYLPRKGGFHKVFKLVSLGRACWWTIPRYANNERFWACQWLVFFCIGACMIRIRRVVQTL